MLLKAARPTPTMAASAPPPMATSHRPVATSRAAAAMAWVPAAQAVAMVSHGPWNPACIETCAAPALTIIMGMRNGDTRRGPFSWNTPICSWSVSSPPTPVAKMTPQRSGSAPISPASASAMSAARHRELREAIDAADFFGAEPCRRVEAHHPALSVGGGFLETVPEGVEADPATRHDAHAGDGHTPSRDRPVRSDPEEHQSLAEISS